jgi:hypothetical protein
VLLVEERFFADVSPRLELMVVKRKTTSTRAAKPRYLDAGNQTHLPRAGSDRPKILDLRCLGISVPPAFGTALVTFSSDLVFDGELPRAYAESDQVYPITATAKARQQPSDASSENRGPRARDPI